MPTSVIYIFALYLPGLLGHALNLLTGEMVTGLLGLSISGTILYRFNRGDAWTRTLMLVANMLGGVAWSGLVIYMLATSGLRFFGESLGFVVLACVAFALIYATHRALTSVSLIAWQADKIERRADEMLALI